MKVFLNPDVEKEVMQDIVLYVAYRIRYGVYDDEIDPLHNPDFVKKESIIEVEKLNKLKIKLSQIKSDFSDKKISEEKPKLIGYLKKSIGFNGYKINEIGSKVYEYKNDIRSK